GDLGPGGAGSPGDPGAEAHLRGEAARGRSGHQPRAGRPGRRSRPQERGSPGQVVLPGLRKLKRLVDGGFFGRILSVRGEVGYWVFEGGWQPAQRPSWNYRKEDGGGIILDMFPHWRYVLDNLFGQVRQVVCLGVTHIPRRVDERN